MREETRPTLYRVMKYWGKKPHNIWSSYIKKYSNKNDKVLDPFVGSGMTYFEAIKLKRIPVTIDLNPISDFSIRCLTYRPFISTSYSIRNISLTVNFSTICNFNRNSISRRNLHILII